MVERAALVTGCLGAIGAAICARLRAEGWTVTGTDQAGAAPGFEGRYHPCDLADAVAVASLLRAVHAAAPGLSLLVNNAGDYRPGPFFDVTVEDFDRAMAVNVRAPFLLGQEVARWMAARGEGGSIVNISSIAGRFGSPVIPYGTSKTALIGLTKSMARVLAPHRIRVNAIAPGVVASPMANAVPSAQMDRQLASIPMGRVGDPGEIAAVVAFLAADASSYMTGSVVDVNGGWPV